MGNGFRSASAFIDIAVDATNQADIWRSIHKNFQIQGIAQYLFDQYENTFQNNNGPRGYLKGFRSAGMGGKIIRWYQYRLPAGQCLKMLHQQICLECIGMIKINLRALVCRDMGKVAIIRIVGNA